MSNDSDQDDARDEAEKLALAERIAAIEVQPIAQRASDYADVVDHLRSRLEEADVRR